VRENGEFLQLMFAFSSPEYLTCYYKSPRMKYIQLILFALGTYLVLLSFLNQIAATVIHKRVSRYSYRQLEGGILLALAAFMI